ncbi:MAG: hypothetical protein LPK26_17350 [Bacillaceae bacterium]|nr:hypothetical protein [Bacillaceae bacterium]
MKKSVAIELDKIRNLRLGVNARCKVEELTGKQISSFEGGLSENDLRIFLYCGLKWEDEELTLEQVGELMDDVIIEQGHQYLGDKITEAIELSMPKKK